MPDLPTRAELFNTFADEIIARGNARANGRRFTPEEIFTDGSDINLLGAGASAMAEEVARRAARNITDLTLDGAEGAALDRWVADRYGTNVVRKAASPAKVQLTLARPTAAAGAFTYPSGSRVQTNGGVQFVTTTSAAFGASDLGPVTVSARAVDAGIGGNVSAGSITAFVTPPSDPTLTVTNSAFASGGDETELDPSLRERARAFFAAARRGTLPAIEFGAKTVPGVRQATAEEELDPVTGERTGRVFVYVADANGQANSLLVDAVAAALLEYRCGGVAPTIIGSTPVYIAIQLALAYDANVDTALAFDQARNVVVGRVNQTVPNGTLYRSVIASAAESVPGVIVTDASIVVPVGDVVPASGQIIRTRTDLVTSA